MSDRYMIVTPADIETVEAAAAELDGVAGALRHCHTTAPAHDDWTDEVEAKASHDGLKEQVAALYALAARMRG